MALLSIPVWSIPPDWANVVTEGLEWNTSILGSPTVAEQRQKLRMSPRRYLDYTITVIDDWRTYTEALLSTTPQTAFYLPVWYELSRTTIDRSSGDVVLVIAGTPAELSASNILFIQGDRPWLYEVAEVTSRSVVEGDTWFTLSTGLTFDWDVGTAVFPVVVAELDAQPSETRLSDTATQMAVRLDFKQANDWAGSISLPTYRGFPVIEFETNETDTQSGSYFRNISLLDNKVGIPLRLDFTTRGFPGFTASNYVVGRGAADDLRSLLYVLQGRLAAAWMVRPSSDFTLRSAIAAHDTSIIVARSGFADLTGPILGRQDIQIRLRTGEILYRRVTAATVNVDETTETLTLDAEVTSEITPRMVHRISFMGLGRLDQDLIEMVHTTDTDGVCNVVMAVKNVPDTRSAADWDAPPLLYPGMEACFALPERPWMLMYDGNPELGDNDAATVSLVAGSGSFDGTGATLLFSAWVEAADNGRGIVWLSASYDPGTGEVVPAPGGEFHCNALIQMVAGGVSCSTFTDLNIQIGASIWPPLTPGKHHVLISVDSVVNQIQCAIDDVISPNNAFGFGEFWNISAPMGSPFVPGSEDVLQAADNSGGGGTGEGAKVCANDVWVKRTSSFVDISNPANRRLFINADLTPATMPTNGVVGGMTPEVYVAVFLGDDPNMWKTNRGTGVQFQEDPVGVSSYIFCNKVPTP